VADQKPGAPPITEEEQAEVAQKRIAQLEERLRDLPKGRPFERGVLRFNLGVAYAESPVGDRQVNLSRGLASLESAAKLFDPFSKPMEHARTQNMLGIVLRELRRHEEAAAAFRRAAEMVPAAVNPGEHGAPMNNLGLTLLDMGEREEAIEAFSDALEAFSGPSFLRQRVDALHNLGQAYAASDDPQDVLKGIDYYGQALDITDPQELPYQWALLQNSLGVAYTGIGQPQKAADAFRQALRVYTRFRFPFQYALAKNNLALANIQIGGTQALRRAVAACEDAIMVLDIRLHREQWEQVYRNLELAEKGLKELGEEGTRMQHFVRLVAEEPDEVAVQSFRERLAEYTALPEPRRLQALAELDLSILGLPDDGAQKLTHAWLTVLMELPQEEFMAGLQGRMAAHGTLDGTALERAVRILDHTIQNELLAPQRIRVRDTLYSIGYRRPGEADEQNGGDAAGGEGASGHAAARPQAEEGTISK
jgi:tetratricopeptide (TPR) repeat protein